VNGPVYKTGTQDFTFPIGSGTAYRPATLKGLSASATDQFSAQYFGTDPDPTYSDASKQGTIDHISSCEYWIINQTNGSPQATVELSWDAPESCGVTDLSELVVCKWNGFQWRNRGNGGTTGTTTSGSVESSAIVTSFSPFTIGSTTANNPLPIELLSFDGRYNGESVDLEWTTQTEINNDYFTIERSANGKEFYPISEVEGAGNSVEALRYAIQDLEPIEGVSYYRLKQTDYDGTYTYSEMVAIEIIRDHKNFKIDFIHSAETQVNVFIDGGEAYLTSLEVYDVTGRLVYSKALAGNQNVRNVPIPGHNLSQGIFYVRISDGQKAETAKFVY